MQAKGITFWDKIMIPQEPKNPTPTGTSLKILVQKGRRESRESNNTHANERGASQYNISYL